MDDDARELQIVSTIPITCTNAQINCEIVVFVRGSGAATTCSFRFVLRLQLILQTLLLTHKNKKKRKARSHFGLFRTLNLILVYFFVSIRDSDWKPAESLAYNVLQPMKVMATRDSFNNAEKVYEIGFLNLTSIIAPAWRNFLPPSIQVSGQSQAKYWRSGCTNTILFNSDLFLSGMQAFVRRRSWREQTPQPFYASLVLWVAPGLVKGARPVWGTSKIIRQIFHVKRFGQQFPWIRPCKVCANETLLHTKHFLYAGGPTRWSLDSLHGYGRPTHHHYPRNVSVVELHLPCLSDSWPASLDGSLKNDTCTSRTNPDLQYFVSWRFMCAHAPPNFADNWQPVENLILHLAWLFLWKGENVHF